MGEMLSGLVGEHWFWALLTAGCVLWYCSVTVIVAVRGASDIGEMLRRLASSQDKSLQ